MNIKGFQSAIEMTLSYLVGLKGVPSVLTHSADERPTRTELMKEIVKSVTGQSKITTMPLLVEFMTEVNAFITHERNERIKTEYKELREHLIVSTPSPRPFQHSIFYTPIFFFRISWVPMAFCLYQLSTSRLVSLMAVR